MIYSAIFHPVSLTYHDKKGYHKRNEYGIYFSSSIFTTCMWDNSIRSGMYIIYTYTEIKINLQ